MPAKSSSVKSQARGQVRAPYRFVPAPEQLVFPDWGPLASHDVPFRDGIRGSFALEIEVLSPLFVGGENPSRNGEENGEEAPEPQPFASDGYGQPVIPGTTLRGLLRQLVAIAGFGRLVLQPRRFGVRDLGGAVADDYRKHLTENVPGGGFRSRARAGWLEREVGPDGEESYRLHPVTYWRVEREQIAALPGVKGGLHERNGIEKRIPLLGRWAEEAVWFVGDEQEQPHGGFYYRAVHALYAAKPDVPRARRGRIVLTGQPQDDAEWGHIPRRKHREFVFALPGPGTRPLEVPRQVFEDFQWAHSGDQKTAGSGDLSRIPPNEAWSYWRERLDNGKPIPVFYTVDEHGALDRMGLAMLFRFASVQDSLGAVRAISPEHDPETSPEKLDLAELLFGHVRETSTGHRGLRGRVAIEPARALSVEWDHEYRVALLGPKPTFYLAYLEQGPQGSKPVSWLTPDARLRGWKQYPARPFREPPAPKGPEAKLASRFKPVKPGSRFRTRVHVHNLRRVELGALLWALRLGQPWGKAVHRLGKGKPYGFGQFRFLLPEGGLALLDMRDQPLGRPELEDCLRDFETYMEEHVPGWRESEQVRSLQALADPQRWAEEDLGYMELEEFRRAKNKPTWAPLPPVVEPRPRSAPPPARTGGKGGRQEPTPTKSQGLARDEAPPPSPRAWSPLKGGSRVQVRLVGRSKKGNWKAELVDYPRGETAGTLLGTEPAGAAEGALFEVTVTAGNNRRNLTFTWKAARRLDD